MNRISRMAAAGAVVAVFALVVATLGAGQVHAEDLPYKAFGVGLKAGATVEALNGTTSVGKTTVDAAGNWILEVPATKAKNGDKITFTIDGVAANETITFQSGQFPTPPGLKLTLAAATPAPTPAATPAAPKPGPGAFAAPPVFSPGGSIAQVVFTGGTVTQLQQAATDARAKSVWAQDANGNFVALIPGAPDFVNAGFNKAFAGGFSSATSITLVGG